MSRKLRSLQISSEFFRIFSKLIDFSLKNSFRRDSKSRNVENIQFHGRLAVPEATRHFKTVVSIWTCEAKRLG